MNKDLVEGHHMEALKEEVGLVCCICREGYKNQPNKVAGQNFVEFEVGVFRGDGVDLRECLYNFWKFLGLFI